MNRFKRSQLGFAGRGGNTRQFRVELDESDSRKYRLRISRWIRPGNCLAHLYDRDAARYQALSPDMTSERS
jgi:hypothetical protein